MISRDLCLFIPARWKKSATGESLRSRHYEGLSKWQEVGLIRRPRYSNLVPSFSRYVPIAMNFILQHPALPHFQTDSLRRPVTESPTEESVNNIVTIISFVHIQCFNYVSNFLPFSN